MKIMTTSFQESVWEAIKQIPRGKVTTYSAIARHLGKPKAVRAVGTAVAKNPYAPQVPCHRVVPQTGKIGKYSGQDGTQGKIRLLEDEGVSIVAGSVDGFYECFYDFSA